MALQDPSWVEAMQEELQQFARLGVWELIDKPARVKKVIPTKWVYKCKKDDRGVTKLVLLFKVFISKRLLITLRFMLQLQD